MGNCVTPTEKKKEEPKLNVQSKDEFVIEKSDFIGVNKQKFKDCYQLGKILGQGALGEVRKCQTRLGKQMRAVKIIKKDKMNAME